MNFSSIVKVAIFSFLISINAHAATSYNQNDVNKQNNIKQKPANQNNNQNQTNRVNIDTSTNEATSRQTTDTSTPTPQQDAMITSKIKSEIKKAGNLSKLNVDVKTKEGVVTLSGNVDSDSQASVIIEKAQSVVGVKDVDADNLKVKSSNQPFQDMMITAKIKGLLIREEIFGTKDIASMNLSVETNNGVVYLTGTVDDKTQVDNAIKLIQGVKGVKKVEYNVNKVTPANSNT